MVVRLKTMRLKNFKGADDETYNFSPGINDITAENGEGKTRRAEAFTWAFWGKDLNDRVNYRIKNEKRPEMRKFDSVVELTLDVNGKEQQIARTYAENWVRPKGQEEDVMKGNTTTYMVNSDGSYNKGQFETFVSSWFSESTFKMLTNPLFFNSDIGKWSWADRRNVLIGIAGAIDNDMIFEEAKDISAARRKALEEVLAEGKDFEAYKREIAGKKKKAKEELEGLPQSIKKLKEVQPEVVDWDALDELIDAADKEYEKANNLFTDRSKISDELGARLDKIRNEIRDARNLATGVESVLKSKLKSDNDLIRLNREILTTDIERLKKQVELLTKTSDNNITRMDAAAEANNKAVDEYTARKNEEEPVLDPDDLKCPACGTEFAPDKVVEMQKTLIENWRVQRAKDMKALKLLAQEKRDEHAAYKKLVAESQKEIDALNDQITAKEEELKVELGKTLGGAKELQELIEASEEHREHTLNVGSLEKKLEGEIKKAEEANKPEELEKLREARVAADNERLRLRGQKATKETFDKIEAEIKDLSKKEKALNKTIADLEGMEFAITKYNAARNEVVTKRVNRLFRTDAQGRAVSFKMFKPNADGTKQEEHCELWFDGKPYSALNTAAKTWAGLECIHAFNEHFKMYLPVFIDNRESVTAIPDMHPDVQIINLRVPQEAPKPVEF